jgi:hypothetical protein
VHPVFRRGVHESLRSQIRLRHRAEQSCGACERFAASKTRFGANAAITKATSAIFWISSRHAAEALFRAARRTFSVGILCEDTADRHPVCLEPEDCGFDPAQFSDVKRRGGAASRGQSGKPGDALASGGAAVARPASDQSFASRGDPRGGARPRRRGSPIRATGRFTFCRKFMRKSVSVARGARYNFEPFVTSLENRIASRW